MPVQVRRVCITFIGVNRRCKSFTFNVILTVHSPTAVASSACRQT